MKFSEQWLREWVNPDITTDELLEQLTMAGLEVDGIEPVAEPFSDVIVAEIVTVAQHPDADKLRVCHVNTGGGEVQVVCGAPNAAVGLKVPFAQVGAVLPGNLKIKKAKLRGVDSSGMLCGASELGLEESSSGLMELPTDAAVGVDIREYLQLDDSIIEVDLTPNRGDCLSIQGIAREVSVINHCDISTPAIPAVSESNDEKLPVTLDCADCSHYVGRVVKNINLNSVAPLWMQERLRRAGIRSIDPVVDVTNYVMLELGQPMHAFDRAKLDGGITVRRARSGEKLTMLNGQEADLNTDTLVIADNQKAVAMAGIMGGEATAVSAQTRDIFLESAFFDPVAITGKARAYGLHTDSSHRFERGVDYNLPAQAVERATKLLLSIVGGEPGPLCIAKNEESLPESKVISCRHARVKQALGLDIEKDDIGDMFTRLGFHVATTDDGWEVKTPSYRFDMSIEADLLEEIARIYGYNRLPSYPLKVDLSLKQNAEGSVSTSAVRQQLIARGYHEAICYSFIDPKLARRFSPTTEFVKLANPMSEDMSVMRTSLLPGLISALIHNLNRQQKRVRLFETGLSFIPDTSKIEQKMLVSGLICGNRLPESWSTQEKSVDFYDLKGDIESILALTGDEPSFSFVAGSHPAMHPGQCAELRRSGKPIGFVGALHPTLQQDLSITLPVFMFEIYLNGLEEAKLPIFQPLSRFPEVRRDIALLVDRELEADELLTVVKDEAGESLVKTTVFDVYQGKGIESNRKSLALSLTYQHPSRTLNEEEINASVGQIVSALNTKLGAILRD